MSSKDFHPFVESLTEVKAKHLIVSGYAVGFHGNKRYTGVIDIWINQTPQNAQRIIKATDLSGFSSLEITEEDLLKT